MKEKICPYIERCEYFCENELSSICYMSCFAYQKKMKEDIKPILKKFKEGLEKCLERE